MPAGWRGAATFGWRGYGSDFTSLKPIIDRREEKGVAPSAPSLLAASWSGLTVRWRGELASAVKAGYLAGLDICLDGELVLVPEVERECL